MVRQCRERMEHQHALTASPRPHVERGPEGGERILPDGPRGGLDGRVVGVLPVVEDDLEPEVAVAERLDVPVAHALEIELGAALAGARPHALDRGAQVHARVVLRFVFVDGHMAELVDRLLQAPLCGSSRIVRIREPGGGGCAEGGDGIVRRASLPPHLPGGPVGEALDARERRLHPRAVAAHEPVAVRAVRAGVRDQVLRPGEDERVGLGGVLVARESAVGLAPDPRDRNGPAEPEGPVASAGVVRERQGRLMPPAARTEPERDRQRCGPRDRVGLERLVDAAQRPAPFWKGHAGAGQEEIAFALGKAFASRGRAIPLPVLEPGIRLAWRLHRNERPPRGSRLLHCFAQRYANRQPMTKNLQQLHRGVRSSAMAAPA